MEGKDTVNESSKPDLSKLFSEELPQFGNVSMLFYISDEWKDKENLSKAIIEHGGNIALYQECFTYQICPKDCLNKLEVKKHYYKGLIYDSHWIYDSIDKKELQLKENYTLIKISEGKPFEFDKGKIPYTIREAIVIYKWISGQKLQKSKRTWQSMVDKGAIYCRTAESLKNFWKTNAKNSMEDCILEMVKNHKKYCHQYPDPIFPNDGVNIKPKEQTVADTDSKGKVIYKKNPNSSNSHHDSNSQTGSKPNSTSKAPITRMSENADFDEDFAPIEEEKDYSIQVVEIIDGSENSHSSEDKNSENSLQLEAEDLEDVFDSDSEPKESKKATPKKEQLVHQEPTQTSKKTIKSK